MATAIRDLRSTFENAMMNSSEVVPLEKFIGDITELEEQHGVRFKLTDILKCWWTSADYMIDAHIQNEHDTPACDCDTPLEERVKKWESMRPSTVRRRELREKFAGL